MEKRFNHPRKPNGLPNGLGSQALPPYYLAYDERYRKVYAQGVEFWTAHPDEVRETTESLDTFLNESSCADPLVLECGCGEGHLAAHLIEQGFRYIGVDISSAAIDKARKRVARCTSRSAPVFHVADSTDLNFLEDASIDILVDNYHFHMLVTDGDRRRYLAETCRVLRGGSRAYFRENLQANGVLESAATYADYLQRTSSDFTVEEEREAWQDGQVIRIRLPRVPARANSREGYYAELETAGFQVQLFRTCKSTCVLHVRKPGLPSETK